MLPCPFTDIAAVKLLGRRMLRIVVTQLHRKTMALLRRQPAPDVVSHRLGDSGAGASCARSATHRSRGETTH
jgi:hypothetical protein